MLRGTSTRVAGVIVATLLLAAAVASCAARGADSAAQPSGGSPLVALRNARVPLDGVLSGGQPTREQIEAAAKAGYRTVINLRTPEESGFEWEAEAVERLGMRYVSIPVAGSEGLTRENVERIDAALVAAAEQGPVLLHCASGNRIGAVLALRQAWIQGVEPEAALKFGRASGMTGLAGTTRELLGLEPDPN
jgi:uncharacterized protein (TIGR01244 family)